MSGDDRASAWIRGFSAEALAPDVFDGFVSWFDAAIVAELGEVTADRELRRDLEASTREQGRAMLIWLTGDSTEVTPPQAAHDLARTIARHGLHLRVLMQIYRVGQKALLRFAAETARERITDPALVPTVLILLLERANQWLNVSLEMLTDSYTEERERGLSGTFALQAEVVRTILRGETVDTAAASTRLRYPLTRYNTALVLRFEDASAEQVDDAIGVLESVVRAVAARSARSRVLTVPSGSRGLWAWIATHAEPDHPTRDIEAHLPAGVSVALGGPAQGVRGFRRSHVEALAAQKISEFQTPASPLTHYRDVEVVHLLDGHPDAARELVSRELRGLDGTDPTSVQLRRTVRTYLDVDQSPGAAARALGVHKNTVRYRIQRVEQMLGRPIVQNRLTLELALQYAAVYGASTAEERE